MPFAALIKFSTTAWSICATKSRHPPQSAQTDTETTASVAEANAASTAGCCSKARSPDRFKSAVCRASRDARSIVSSLRSSTSMRMTTSPLCASARCDRPVITEAISRTQIAARIAKQRFLGKQAAHNAPSPRSRALFATEALYVSCCTDGVFPGDLLAVPLSASLIINQSAPLCFPP